VTLLSVTLVHHVKQPGTVAKTIEVFFYGLFMDPSELRRRGVIPTDWRRASVAGMALRISERATLIPMPGSTVYGLVMGVADGDIRHLYSDLSLADYRPEQMSAHLDDGTDVRCLSFVLPRGVPLADANPAYAEKLRTAAVKMGLHDSYVDTIR
jgi:hypothetical protein